MVQLLKFFKGKAHGITDSEKKGRKHQVRWRKPVPVCVEQRRKSSSAATRAIHNNHETDSQSSKHIERKKTGSRFDRIVVLVTKNAECMYYSIKL